MDILTQLGLDEMDYLIVDKNLIKPTDEKYYNEKIIYLPKIWNCHNGYETNRKENDSPSIKKNLLLLDHLIILKN